MNIETAPGTSTNEGLLNGMKTMTMEAYRFMARKNKFPEVFYCTINLTGARGFLDRKVTVDTPLNHQVEHAFKQFDRFFSAFQRSLVRPTYRFAVDAQGGLLCSARKNVGSPLKWPDDNEWRIKAFVWVGHPGDKIKSRRKQGLGDDGNGFRTKLDRIGLHVHFLLLIHRHIAQNFSTGELKQRMDEMARLSLGSAYEDGDFRRVADLTSDVERIVGYSSKIMSSQLEGLPDIVTTDLFDVWPQGK